jgi:hypothetical protein
MVVLDDDRREKMKTSELTGPALDWAVAKCEGMSVEYIDDGITQCLLMSMGGRFNPSTNWAQGGPIIEREKITLEWTGENWMAYIWHDVEFFGPTPLVAAMCCYVASKLGDDIDIPEGLMETATRGA